MKGFSGYGRYLNKDLSSGEYFWVQKMKLMVIELNTHVKS